MFATLDLDPEAAAAALDELASDLRRDPSRLGSTPELNPKSLAETERIVQRWAVEHGAPAVCVPERPIPQELTVQRALLFLSDLAAVIRYIAANIQPENDMRRVVAKLRARHDEALGEIVELGFALTEVLENLTIVAGAAEALHAGLTKMRPNGAGQDELSQLQTDAELIHSALEHLLACQRELGRGVKAWLAVPGATTSLS
jgi:hypothetical protein